MRRVADEPLGVYRIHQDWKGHTLTGWPGFDLMAERVAWGVGGCPADGYYYWNVTDTVRNWTSNAWPAGTPPGTARSARTRSRSIRG